MKKTQTKCFFSFYHLKKQTMEEEYNRYCFINFYRFFYLMYPYN